METFLFKSLSKINNKGPNKIVERISKPKSCFSEKINKIDKLLAKLTKKKREDPNKQNKKWKRKSKTTNATDIWNIIGKYYEQLYMSKLENLEEMDRFLERHKLPIPNQEEKDKLNGPITNSEIEFIIK